MSSKKRLENKRRLLEKERKMKNRMRRRNVGQEQPRAQPVQCAMVSVVAQPGASDKDQILEKGEVNVVALRSGKQVVQREFPRRPDPRRTKS